MTEKDLVQEALQQMKNLEDVVQENAKGILGATMAQEISELVKESLIKETKKKESKEQDDEEEGAEMDDMEGPEMDDMEGPEMDDMEGPEMDDMEGPEMDDMEGPEMDNVSMMDTEDDDVIDATNLDGEKLWNLFKKIDPSKDQILVQSEGDNIHIKDDENDVEYILKMNENYLNEGFEDDDYMGSDEMGVEDVSDVEDIYSDVFSEMDDYMDEDMDENLYEDMYEDMDETIYEIEMDEETEESEMYEMEDMDEDMDDEDYVNEAKYMIKPVMGKMKNKGEAKENKTMKSASRGLKKSEAKEGNYMSKPIKPTKQTKVDGFKKETLPEKGISNVMKKETKEGKTIAPTAKSKGVGMNLKPKKFEYKEAARTYGNGSKQGRGLRKGITPNRNFVYENEILQQEIEVLKEKNEEYRKALNVFREKLNEVAVFNSNLAYATRLFTEHSTSKTEKINILRRFDDVETLKESKSLYSAIKNELSQTTNNNKVVSESIERKIEKTASTGSATNLIESKTYENPQFLRMKDLMGKLQK